MATQAGSTVMGTINQTQTNTQSFATEPKEPGTLFGQQKESSPVPTASAIFCPNCGKECQATANFCTNCGQKLKDN